MEGRGIISDQARQTMDMIDTLLSQDKVCLAADKEGFVLSPKLLEYLERDSCLELLEYLFHLRNGQG